MRDVIEKMNVVIEKGRVIFYGRSMEESMKKAIRKVSFFDCSFSVYLTSGCNIVSAFFLFHP